MVGTHSSPHRELHVALLGLLELGLISSLQLSPCPYKPKSPEALEVPCHVPRAPGYHILPGSSPVSSTMASWPPGSRFLTERWEQSWGLPHNIVTRKQHSEEQPGTRQPQIRPAEHLSPHLNLPPQRSPCTLPVPPTHQIHTVFIDDRSPSPFHLLRPFSAPPPRALDPRGYI